MDRDALLALSKDDLIALILAQAAQISALTARVAELEAKLAASPKTPGNSSLPPSKGQKANCPDRPKAPRRGRPGVTRALAEDPDHVIEATLAACPHCAHPLAAADQPDVHAYDHIDLPSIRPVVTRIHRRRGGAHQPRGRLRRNLGAGGGQDLVAVGPARLDRHLPPDR